MDSTNICRSQKYNRIHYHNPIFHLVEIRLLIKLRAVYQYRNAVVASNNAGLEYGYTNI